MYVTTQGGPISFGLRKKIRRKTRKEGNQKKERIIHNIAFKVTQRITMLLPPNTRIYYYSRTWNAMFDDVAVTTTIKRIRSIGCTNHLDLVRETLIRIPSVNLYVHCLLLHCSFSFSLSLSLRNPAILYARTYAFMYNALSTINNDEHNIHAKWIF